MPVTDSAPKPLVDREIPPPAKNLPATQQDVQSIDELIQLRGLNKQEFKVLSETIHPNAQTAGSVLMAFDYCKAKKLDPFKRCVHIVPVYSKRHQKMIETVWMGIAAIRIEAHRTSEYAGCEDCEFGPDITKKFKYGNSEVELTFPQWAQFTVYRIVKGEVRKFAGPKVRFLEYYATEKKDSDIPNDIWRDRPYAQLEKCAESAALQRAFPEAAETSAEEMDGQVLNDALPASRKEQNEMASALAQEIANQNAGVTTVDVVAEVMNDDAPPPVAATFQERMEAKAQVAEATGATQAEVEALKEAAKPGITGPQANTLMKKAQPNGWSTKDLVNHVVKTYGVDEKKWMAEITQRQYNETVDFVEANKPER